jgi:hypothetical protein
MVTVTESACAPDAGAAVSAEIWRVEAESAVPPAPRLTLYGVGLVQVTETFAAFAVAADA